jgi:hypothetical protein
VTPVLPAPLPRQPLVTFRFITVVAGAELELLVVAIELLLATGVELGVDELSAASEELTATEDGAAEVVAAADDVATTDDELGAILAVDEDFAPPPPPLPPPQADNPIAIRDTNRRFWYLGMVLFSCFMVYCCGQLHHKVRHLYTSQCKDW